MRLAVLIAGKSATPCAACGYSPRVGLFARTKTPAASVVVTGPGPGALKSHFDGEMVDRCSTCRTPAAGCTRILRYARLQSQARACSPGHPSKPEPSCPGSAVITGCRPCSHAFAAPPDHRPVLEPAPEHVGHQRSQPMADSTPARHRDAIPAGVP